MTAPSSVKAVVFDIGQVLHEWDPRHLYRKLFDDDNEMEHFLATVCTPAWNLSLDRGRDWDEAVETLSLAHPDYKTEILAFRDRWEEMAPRAIEGSVALKETLQNYNIPVYGLTNYSRRTFDLSRKRFEFLNDFDGLIVSADIGAIKPEPAIYQALCDTYDLTPETLVFIDDSPANIAGARAFGMKGIIFASPAQTSRELAALGLPV